MSLLYHAYVYLEFLILACTIYILAPEKIKKEIEYSAMSEARKEVISLLGGALAGVKNSQPVVIANPQEDMEEQPEEDVMNDSDVAGLAMGWMLKGD